MEAGLTTEAPLCTYDFNTHILTTPRDEAQEGVLSDVRSLSFFKDVLAEKLAADFSKLSLIRENICGGNSVSVLPYPHPTIIDGDMRWDSGWFLGGFGVVVHLTRD